MHDVFRSILEAVVIVISCYASYKCGKAQGKIEAEDED